MKGLYLCNHNLKDQSSGVSKKILMQLDAFNKSGYSIDILDIYSDSFLDKVIRRILFSPNYFTYNLNKKLNFVKKYDYIYIRQIPNNIYVLKILKKLKSYGITIIYEFPTFPYDLNSNTLQWKLELIRDKYSRKKLWKYIDVSVNYSDYTNIFGINSIPISNGINPDKFPIKKDFFNKKGIKFVGVALLAYWNGYDRLIQSIKKYNSNHINPVYFYIVGDGDCKEELEKMVIDNNLLNFVFFTGSLFGKELDNIYDKCDIGVGTLNPSRKYKNHIMSTLKTKEYVARGLPFIKGDIDKSFDNYNFPYVFNVSDNEDEINLEEIIEWYKKITDDLNLKQKIRKFAYDNLTWEKQLHPVFEFLNEVKK